MQSIRRSPFKATNIVLLIICLMYLITYIDRVNIATAAPPMQKDLALTNTQLGIAISAFAYPYALFQIIGGWLGDRLGPRVTLLICGTIWSVATVLIGFVDGAISLVLARLLLGIGEGTAFPTATRALASWMPADKRGFAQGITHSFSRFGNAVSPAIIAALIGWLTWRGSSSCRRSCARRKRKASGSSPRAITLQWATTATTVPTAASGDRCRKRICAGRRS